MKIILLVLIVCSTAIGNRKRRGQCDLHGKHRDAWMQRKNESECRPVLKPVPLIAPRGIARVSPPVVYIKQCDENMNVECPNMKCMPVYGRTESIKVKAKLYKRINSRCTSVQSIEVVEHHACECRCPGKEMCNDNQDYNENMCRCDCKEDERKKCQRWQTMGGPARHMWIKDICECRCNKVKTCGTGEYFSDIACRCETM